MLALPWWQQVESFLLRCLIKPDISFNVTAWSVPHTFTQPNKMKWLKQEWLLAEKLRLWGDLDTTATHTHTQPVQSFRLRPKQHITHFQKQEIQVMLCVDIHLNNNETIDILKPNSVPEVLNRGSATSWGSTEVLQQWGCEIFPNCTFFYTSHFLD